MEFLNKRTESKRNWINKYLIFFAGMSYLLIILIFLIPNFSQLNDSIIGSSDAVQVYGEQVNNINEFNDFTSEERMDYFIQKLNPLKLLSFNTHLTLLGLTFGSELGFNLYWIMSFVLAGMGMFLLAKKLIKNNSAAFIAGLIFAFSPTHFAYAQGYGGATHIEWIPFFIFFLIKFFEKYKISNYVFAGIFYLLIYANEPHFTLYVSIFALLFVIYKIYKNPQVLKNRRFVSFLIISCILLLIAVGSQYYKRSDMSLAADLGQVIEFSNDSLAIITPPVFHRIWGDYFLPFVDSNYTGNSAENTIYLGLITFFLVLMALLNRKRIKDFNFWFFGGILFFIFSLGPFLHFKGVISPMIPSLYSIFYEYFPGFQNIRSVGRIFVVSIFCFSILAGWGFSFVISWLKNKFTKIRYNFLLVFCLVLFSSLILIDYIPEFITSKIVIPNFYHEQLAAEEGDYYILQPLITTSYKFASESKVYNNSHDKNIFWGDYSLDFVRKDIDKLRYKTETPVINNLLYSLPLGLNKTDIMDYDYSKIGNYYLNQNNIKYIILHKEFVIEGDDNFEANYLRQSDYENMVNFVEENIVTEKIIDDNELLVYEVSQEDQLPLIIQVGENTLPDWRGNYWWENERNYSSNPARWIEDGSTFTIHNTSETTLPVVINFADFDSAWQFFKVKYSLDDQELGEFVVVPDISSGKEIFLPAVTSGDHVLSFSVVDTSDVSVVIDKISKDQGIFVSGVSYYLGSSEEKTDIPWTDLENDHVLILPSQKIDLFSQYITLEKYCQFSMCDSLLIGQLFNQSSLAKSGVENIIIDKSAYLPNELSIIQTSFFNNSVIHGLVSETDKYALYEVSQDPIISCLADRADQGSEVAQALDWDKYYASTDESGVIYAANYSGAVKSSLLEQYSFSCLKDFNIQGKFTLKEWSGGEIRLGFDNLGVLIKMYSLHEGVVYYGSDQEKIFSHNLKMGEENNLRIERRDSTLKFYENNALIMELEDKSLVDKYLEKMTFSLVPYPEQIISLQLGEFSISPRN